MKIKKLILTSIFSMLCFSGISKAESFRVRKTHILSIQNAPNSSMSIAKSASEIVTAGINDSICILLPDDMTFIQGIEVYVKIPPEIARFPNTIIYSLYDNISPVPSEKTIDYTGKELYTSIYPGKVAQTIQIPLIKGNTIKQSPYADKTFVPDTSRGFVFLRNQLAMKGIPKDTVNGKFIISAKPIYTNKGQLKISAGTVKPNDLTVVIDDKVIELSNNGTYFLAPGSYTVSVSSEGFRNQTRTVIIETAKISELNIEFQSVTPTLKINMPTGTLVNVDNQNIELKGSVLDLTPGEHILKFTLGGYEIVKKITVQEGRSYTINVTIDADLSEN